VTVAVPAQTVRAGRREVEITHPGKVMFPADGITKRDLADYYVAVAGRMLPHLADRPLMLARYIELHVLLSRAGAVIRPDQLVFDLDPPGPEGFGDARQVALALRGLLEDELGLVAFPRTTGGNGLHVHVPLRAGEDFGAVRGLAAAVAGVLAGRHPDQVTTQQRRAARGGRVYADIMRNAYAQTVIAPYAVRARPGATVSAPLSWDEVADTGLTPGRFTLRTMPERLAGGGQARTRGRKWAAGGAGSARRAGRCPA
jgi:bifunctional non-homologous end joining protein LigD